VTLPPLAGPDFVCDDCSMAYPATTAEAATAMVRAVPAAYRVAVGDLADDVFRRRLAPGTWSILEYVCHVRDVHAVFIERIGLALTEDHPTYEPLGNDRRAVVRRYNEADLATTLAELDDAAQRLAELLDTLDDDGWRRTASRLPGEDRDVLWMARQTAHEGRHHLRDIERIRDDAGLDSRR
jgi:hypothetical protein